MPCYHPISAYRSDSPNPSGKFGLVFNPGKRAAALAPIEIPCGRCIGCRLERSRQWALRMTHEASLHTENCFLTLTFDPDHLPSPPTISKRDVQLFLKRLRKHLEPKKISFFACGEYGEEFGRPHYHAIIFGYDPPDKILYSVNGRGDRIYESSALQSVWGLGNVRIGDVTFESAAYCARYIMKKYTGEGAEEHYQRVDENTGELYQLAPEFCLMSRRPAIGLDWYKIYKNDLAKGFITSRGIKMQQPKYYDRKMEQDRPLLLDDLKQSRILNALDNTHDNTDERLAVREVIKNRQLKILSRNIE